MFDRTRARDTGGRTFFFVFLVFMGHTGRKS